MNILLTRLSSLRDTQASSTYRALADLIHEADPASGIGLDFYPAAADWRVFDLIFITDSYLSETLNLPKGIKKFGVSPWAQERPEDFPPVLLGGSNALAAQCLVCEDGTAVPDVFFFGEAEASLVPFLRRWPLTSGKKKDRLLAATQGLDGFWVTGGFYPVVQAVSRRSPPPPSPILPPNSPEAGTARLQVSSGCPAFCSFCFEGYERKPYREYPPKFILQRALELKRTTGADTLLLDAYNLNNYSGLREIVLPLSRLFRRLSFKSQRADGVAATPSIIALELAAGKQSFTVGIEGISPRLRAFLNKSLSDVSLFKALQTLFDYRVREIKLFFILTAYETSADLEAFNRLASFVRDFTARPDCGTRVIFSFGYLVRMPNTPLQYDKLFLNESDWKFAADGVMAICRRLRLEGRFAFDFSEYRRSQILAACSHTDARRIVESGIDDVFPEKHAGELLFPGLMRTVSSGFLRSQWESAVAERDSGYCLGTKCLACGACTETERAAVISHPGTPAIPKELIEEVRKTERMKQQIRPILTPVELPEICRNKRPEWVSMYVTRMLGADVILAAEEILYSDTARFNMPSGKTIAAVYSLEPLHLATVGMPTQLRWRIETDAEPRRTAELLSHWLRENRLAHTLVRQTEGYRIEFAPTSVKKKIILSAEVDKLSAIDISFALKADLSGLLATLVNPVCTSIGYN